MKSKKKQKMEAIKHFLGFCGDTWHPSILNVGMLISPFVLIYRNFIYKFKTLHHTKKIFSKTKK